MEQGERFNCLSHLTGLILTVLGGTWILSKHSATENMPAIIGTAVFVAAATFLYLSSTLYHATRAPIKQYWEKLDHCSIFTLIAATVTPFMLKTGMSGLSWTTLTLIWFLAACGVVKELRAALGTPPPLWLYISLGWIGVFAVFQEWQQLSETALLFLLAGAFAYTVGTYFYRNGSRRTHAHGVWHLFVMAGTVFHFLSIQTYLA